ncbi:MAG: GAF domain-containing protein [Actinomycetota bacterium]|nr:GAF domain-containing protein [Actinomycetota bacterium]
MKLCKEIEPQIAELLERMAQSLGTDAAGFAVVNGDESIGYCALYNIADHMGKLSVSKGIDVLGMVLATQKTTVIDDYASFPKAISAWIQVGARSVASAPVLVNGNLVGAMTALSIDKARSFSQTDVETIEAFAGRAASLLEVAMSRQT